MVVERGTKSVSVEGTYDTDLTDRRLMEGLLTRQADGVAKRLKASALSGRTVTLKLRLHDFTTLNRSTTLPSPTDSAATIARLARALLADLDTSGGVRLLGVGRVRPGRLDPGGPVRRHRRRDRHPTRTCRRTCRPTGTAPGHPGSDVVHATLGPGWVWGSGRGVVTVRFETRDSPAGPVRSFAVDDPELSAWQDR